MLLLWTAVVVGSAGMTQPKVSEVAAPPPVAVVELFTSEGCSSCPPADRVLGEMVARAGREGARIYPLAFHVDYWDNLGWKDPYARPEFTRRQREYAAAFKTGVYTPQMVVNGAREFVGSEKERADATVRAALEQPARVGVTVMASVAHEKVQVQYTLSGDLKGLNVQAALVERGLTSRVPRGENSGKTLSHENVVRVFVSTPAQAKGTIELEPPKDAKLPNCGVVVYVQGADHVVVGAGAVESIAADR